MPCALTGTSHLQTTSVGSGTRKKERERRKKGVKILAILVFVRAFRLLCRTGKTRKAEGGEAERRGAMESFWEITNTTLGGTREGAKRRAGAITYKGTWKRGGTGCETSIEEQGERVTDEDRTFNLKKAEKPAGKQTEDRTRKEEQYFKEK